MTLLKLERFTQGISKYKVNSSGIYPFPLFLKRSRLPRKYSIQQPGVPYASEFYHASDLEVKLKIIH